ncbi:MAG: 2-oxoglutarate and iron-dependent oxygenase domain-containing protein, partial [Shewanella sp.]|nr:2-oxoglutarate and iron-dependent oxygenase domain-containing protein [Shewanella sp.]
MEQLPILNLSDWHAGGQSRHAFITKLADAARRIGFFYLTGHGIELARQQQVLQ